MHPNATPVAGMEEVRGAADDLFKNSTSTFFRRQALMANKKPPEGGHHCSILTTPAGDELHQPATPSQLGALHRFRVLER
jgi:hypothetical protein